MLKRRSTLDSTEKARRNRQTEYCLDLDKCLRTPPTTQKSPTTSVCCCAVKSRTATPN